MSELVRRVAVSAIAFGAISVAYALQQAWSLEPCTMCIVQRYAFLVIGIGACGRYLAGGLVAAVARVAAPGAVLVGLLASARIQWAISVPSQTCGRDKVAAALNGAPWVDAWPAMFEATGVCGDKVAPVLGLPFHAWSALLFVAIAGLFWFPRK